MAYFRKRGNAWSFTVDVGRDPITNKRKQKTVTGFKSEGEARIACEKFERELAQGRKSDHITLGAFIKEYYETEVKHQVEEHTYVTQWIWARDYVIPKLGKMRLDRIAHADIVKFYNSLLNDGVARGSIKNIAMVLKKTLKAAVVWDYIIKNPADHAPVPTYKPPQMTIWTQEQVNEFLQKSETSYLYPLYVIAFTTGMRLGEMLALTWDDIKHNTIHVTKSLKHTGASGLHLKYPKNKNAIRTITIPQFTIEKLMEHKEKQLEGTNIIIDNIGKYIYATDAWRQFKKDAAACGLPPIRIHDIRHTHATHLLQKYPVKVVAERLGDTPHTIFTTYAHVLPTMQQEVADHLDNLFEHVDNFE